MSGRADFAYGHARIQARHGSRLREAEWRQLQATHDMAQYLHVLRGTTRARWVERIVSDTSAHALDTRLRAEARAYAREVARLQPEAWQPAIGWTQFLVDLPVIEHLRRGGAVLGWMAEDEIYAPWSHASAAEREHALEASPLAPLVQETRSGVSAAQAWLAVWRRLWPRVSAEESVALESLIHVVEQHIAALRVARQTRSEELRGELGRRLGVLFRRHIETAAATVAHLLLEAMDLERVRAALMRRLLRDTAKAAIA